MYFAYSDLPRINHTSIYIHSHPQNMVRQKKNSLRCPKLTCVGAYMLARGTATVLAFGIAVRILRHVFVAVVLTALLTCAKLHHFEVLGRRMVAVLASQVSGGRRRTVFLALAPGTLPPLDSLHVLHLASTGVHTRAASREFPYSELTHTLCGARTCKLNTLKLYFAILSIPSSS